jgi:ADP-heptose:LPS heptosyltransferase
LQHLRDTFADAELTLVCGSWNVGLAERSELFNRVLAFDFFVTQGVYVSDWESAFSVLPLGTYHLAIDLRHDSDTRQVLALVKAAFRAGFCAPANAGGETLDIALPDVENVSIKSGTGRPLHAEQRLLMLANIVTSTFAPKPHPAHRLLSQDKNYRGSGRPYAVLSPGAGQSIRIWPVDRLIEVARKLIDQHGLDIVVIGGTAEQDAGSAFLHALPEGRVHNVAGSLSMTDLPNLLHSACLYVGYDTGPTHLAAGLGVPTVSVLSGVPSSEVWHTIGQQVVVLTGGAACSPCHLSRPAQCPFGTICLDIIRADDVVAACESLLLRCRTATTTD